MNQTAQTSASVPQAAPAPRAPGIFACLALLLGIGALLGVVGSASSESFAVPLGLGAVALTGAIVPGPTRRVVFRVLTSLSFAVALLALVLLATILGTLILQGQTGEAYAKRYGPAVVPLILGPGLDDIFHAPWYVGWLALLAVSLLLVPIRRKVWRPVQWGHGLAHLGVVLILAGAYVGVRYGFKGYINLHEGLIADAAVSTAPSGGKPDLRPLGFSLRLDDFDIEFYPTKPKFTLYERVGESFEPRKVVKLEDAGAWTRAGSVGVEFRMVRRIPASHRDVDPHVLIVRRDANAAPEEISVKPGATVSAADGAWQVRVLGFYPDFVIDPDTHRPTTRSPHPNNPALQVEVLPADGGPAQRRWLFARMPEFDHGGGGRGGPLIRYRHTPVEIPAQVEVEVRSPEGEGTHRFDAREGGSLQLPDGKTVLSYERKEEVKEYRSRLSVLEGGRPVTEKTIEVNDPLTWGGWSFYQSNYRREDLTYSGIQVVSDPGLPLVWAGLFAMCVGIAFIYYVRPRMLRPKEGS